MDKREAQQLLDDFVAALRSRFAYQDWQKLIGESEVVETEGPSGGAYQIEWSVFWDGHPGGAIRVLVSIDDGSLIRSMIPLSTSLLIPKPMCALRT
jgi:hypothetical protein